MATWTKGLADKHTYLLSKSLSVNETYTLLVSGSPVDMKCEVYLGTDFFIGYLEGNKLTFTLEQASDAMFLTFYILSSDAEIKTIKLETGGNPTNYKPATAELLLPLNRDSYMSPAMTYQMNGNILNFDGETVKRVTKDSNGNPIVVSRKGINLVRNGNFANETTNWVKNCSKISEDDGLLKVVGDGTLAVPMAYQHFTKVINHKYYGKAEMMIESDECIAISIAIGQSINEKTNPEPNTWYEMEGIVDVTSTSSSQFYLYHNYVDSITAKEKIMYARYVQLIDLTEAYGAGNEPDLTYIQSHPEEFAWTPNPNDLIETVEIKNNLVGDLENLQGNDFEQHEDGVITYTNEAEEGSVVRVDIDGISDQPLRFRNATGEQVVITEHDQIDTDAIKKVEFQGNSVQLADKYREVSGTSVTIAPELHDKNVADKLVIGGNTTQYTESSNVVTDGLQMWLSGRNFSNNPATTVWKDLTGVNNGTASGFEYRTNVYADVVSDFTGKVAGSVVENANIFKYSISTTLQVPTGGLEYTQEPYDRVKTLDGTSKEMSRTVNGEIGQQIFSFNVIKAFEKQHGNIPSTDQTTAGKVAWLKDNLSDISAKWYGYGSCPSGNKASIYIFSNAWYKNALGWDVFTSSPSLITASTSNFNAYMQADGFVHYLVCTDASDGVTASTVYTDYVSLTLTTSGASGSDGNGGVNFDGVDDKVVLDNPIIKGVAFTAEVLFSIKKIKVEQVLIAQYTSHIGRFLFGVRHSKLGFFIGGVWLDSITNLSINTMYHAVITRNFDGTAKIYINGLLDKSGNLGVNSVPMVPTVLGMNLSSNELDGVIKFARIYNRVLSDAEVLQNYNAGLSIPIPNIAMPQEVKHVNSGSKVLVHGKNLININGTLSQAEGRNSAGYSGSANFLNLLKNYDVIEGLYSIGTYIYDNGSVNYTVNNNVVTISATDTNGRIGFVVRGLIPGKSYYAKYNGVAPFSNNPALLIHFYDESSKKISSIGGTYRTSQGFVCPQNTRYALVYAFAGEGYSFTNIQLEEGTIATAYEPFKGYQETTIPVTLRSIG